MFHNEDIEFVGVGILIPNDHAFGQWGYVYHIYWGKSLSCRCTHVCVFAVFSKRRRNVEKVMIYETIRRSIASPHDLLVFQSKGTHFYDLHI